MAADFHVGFPDCPDLPMLESLELDMAGGAFSLLKKILAASQLGSLSLRSKLRLIAEQHADIATTLERQNRSLQFLSCPWIEASRGSEGFFQNNEGYLALVECARTHKRRSEMAEVADLVPAACSRP
ncbi:hypothetical protein GCM10023165_05220 [Variovorax defluvii]|uniref:Uncharacterized protein n=1 Tax=Variovorax defluvii TaxID=913761 RepID=A0ABP8GX61_9BURK